MNNKRAAMEMSIGTIVIIVLAMTMLIFGIILVKKIMCTGLQTTDQISEGLKTEIRNLFGQSDFGVKCVGESGSAEVKYTDGGSREVACIIKTDDNREYSLEVKKIAALSGASTTTVNKWVTFEVDETNSYSGSAQGDSVRVLLLNIPRGVQATTISIDVEETDQSTDKKKLHSLIVYVTPAGAITSAMC